MTNEKKLARTLLLEHYYEHFLAKGYPPEEADILAYQRFKERTDEAYEPPEMR